MRDGGRVRPSPTLDEVRDYTSAQLATLPDSLRDLHEKAGYEVEVSTTLREIADQIDRAAH